MADKNPTIYSGKPWRFNSGDPARGRFGLVDVPAGASALLSATELQHPYAKQHASASPILGTNAGGEASSDDFAKVNAKLAAITAERDQLAAHGKAMNEELEALRTAIGQSATERETQLGAQLKAAAAELAQVRGQLAQAQAAAKK